MTQERTVVSGTVLPGQTMVPPYASHIRCVVWAAGDSKVDEASASAAVAFRLLLDDGREVTIDPIGAMAALPVRWTASYQREVNVAEALRRGILETYEGRRPVTQEVRSVAWIAVGDAVSVRGRLVDPGRPFGGATLLLAEEVMVEGGTLRVASLAAGEPEP